MKELSADKKEDIQALINKRVQQSASRPRLSARLSFRRSSVVCARRAARARAGLGDRPKAPEKPAAKAPVEEKASESEDAAATKKEAAGIVKEAEKAYKARLDDREKAKTASKDELQAMIDLKISGGAKTEEKKDDEEKKAE